MKTKIALLTIVLVTILGIFGASAQAANATPTDSQVKVNGNTIAFEAYNILDNNYFKLRDIAYILSGSEKSFSVDWESGHIFLTTGCSYSPVGGEMAKGNSNSMEAVSTGSPIILNDMRLSMIAYNIGGNNFFKLRDLAQIIDFAVDWDASAGCISIDTSRSYEKPEVFGTQPRFDNYPLLLVGMEKERIDLNLGKPSSAGNHTGMKYPNGLYLGFETLDPNYTVFPNSKCYIVQGSVANLISNCPASLSRTQMEALIGSSKLFYNDFNSNWYLHFDFGGIPLTIDCDSNGRVKSSDRFLYNIVNAYSYDVVGYEKYA